MQAWIHSKSLNRRQALRRMSCGFGYLALAALERRRLLAGPDSAAFQFHFRPRAKRAIFIFMQGGPSQVDTFDYKPRLATDDGKRLEFRDARTIANSGKNDPSAQRVLQSPWSFRQYGQTGRWVSELFPELAQHVDDLCFIHSLHTDGVAHGPATLFLHCGATQFVRPSVGSWIAYGLGTENENLPGFVTICPPAGNGGSRNYGHAFLPAVCQGTALGRAGSPMDQVRIRNLAAAEGSGETAERRFELLRGLNRDQLSQHAGDSELEAVIESYELAWRMQRHAPGVLELSKETPSTLALYGIGQEPTDRFGRQCLMARRLCEAGVRYVQVTYGDNSANPAWDQHSNLPKHAEHARATDKPVAGLLTDLKRRGLLEDTVVWWGGEFGRTPYAEKNGTGRDHNPGGFTVWLAGGGVRAGLAYGQTDAFGHHAIADKVHMHDLHATLLHLLGLDHERLTYRYAGRDFRLTDVYGEVVHELLA